MLSRIASFVSNPPGRNASPEYSPESAAAVYDVLHALRQKLPAELVVMILDAAEYWPRQTHAVQGRARVNETNSPFAVASLVVHTRSCHPHPVRQVRMAVQSRDQGWVTHRDAGSWSWFNAVIVAPEGDEQIVIERVITNIQGSREPRLHEILWSSERGIEIGEGKDGKRVGDADTEGEADEDEDEEEAVEVEPAVGRVGSCPEGAESAVLSEEKITVREAVRSISHGTTIKLSANARFARWENIVSSARIDVYTAAVH